MASSREITGQVRLKRFVVPLRRAVLLWPMPAKPNKQKTRVVVQMHWNCEWKKPVGVPVVKGLRTQVQAHGTALHNPRRAKQIPQRAREERARAQCTHRRAAQLMVAAAAAAAAVAAATAAAAVVVVAVAATAGVATVMGSRRSACVPANAALPKRPPPSIWRVPRTLLRVRLRRS